MRPGSRSGRSGELLAQAVDGGRVSMMDSNSMLSAILAGTLGLGSGCNVILDFQQCDVDDDCARVADANESLVCGADKTCIAADERSCSHSECAAMGENMVCGAAGTCMSATSPECTYIPHGIDRDNLILFGAIHPTSGDFANAGRPQESAIELALEEFNESGQLGDLRFALIGCDDAGDQERALAAARHLVDLGVPVVFGPAFSGIFIEVSTSVTVPAGVVTVSGSATSATISELDDQGLSWRTVASDAFQSVAVADRIRTLRQEQPGLKVAAFGKDDQYGKGLLFAVGAELEAELGDDNYYGVLYGDASTGDPVDLTQVVVDAVSSNFADADVVLIFGTIEVLDVLQAYEQYLVNSDATELPVYIMTDGGKLSETLALVADRPDLAPRIEGTVPSLENGSIYTGFKQRFQAKFGRDPEIYAGNAYDAAYLMAYASTVLTDRGLDRTTLDGPSVSEFMNRVVEGQTVEAGPSDLAAALTTLGAGAAIDFEGASGPLGFDLTAGEAPSNVDRWVVRQDANGNWEFVLEGRYLVGGNGRGTWMFE